MWKQSYVYQGYLVYAKNWEPPSITPMFSFGLQPFIRPVCGPGLDPMILLFVLSGFLFLTQPTNCSTHTFVPSLTYNDKHENKLNIKAKLWCHAFHFPVMGAAVVLSCHPAFQNFNLSAVFVALHHVVVTNAL